MCGICGFIGEVDDSKKVLKQMMDKIAHRGPDDEGMYVDKHAAIGHRRLSIIDLSHGCPAQVHNFPEDPIPHR